MDAVLLLIQAVLIFGVAFIYANLGLGGGLLFVPILLSTGVPDKDLAVPISLTLTIMTATSSVINHHRRGLVDFRLGGVLLTGALIGAVVGTVFTLKVLNQETFEAFFAAVLIVFGLYMVRDWVKNARSVDEDDDSALTPPRVGGTLAASPEPKRWDGPPGRVSLVRLVPPARRRRRRDVDLDSVVRVRARRIAPHGRHHRGRHEPRVGPRLHLMGVALRSHRAPQGLPPDRFPRQRARPLCDGPLWDDVPVLPRESPRGFLGRGERPRRDGPPHGDLEADGMARAARPGESDRSDRVGRGIGHGGRLARHRTGTAQRGAVVDARALRDRRRARAPVRSPRSGLDSGTGGPRGSPGRSPHRRQCPHRARSISADPDPSLHQPARLAKEGATSARAPHVSRLRLPLVRRIHRVLWVLPDFLEGVVRTRKSRDLRGLHREPGDLDRRVSSRRPLGLGPRGSIDAVVCGRGPIDAVPVVPARRDRGGAVRRTSWPR